MGSLLHLVKRKIGLSVKKENRRLKLYVYFILRENLYFVSTAFLSEDFNTNSDGTCVYESILTSILLSCEFGGVSVKVEKKKRVKFQTGASASNQISQLSKSG